MKSHEIQTYHIYIYITKSKCQILKDANQHSYQEIYVQDAVPIGLPGAWPSPMFLHMGKIGHSVFANEMLRFLSFLFEGFVGIYCFSVFLEILA